MTKNEVVDEWRKQDPYLLDVDGMLEFIERRSQAQELLRLIRLCHPDEHGEAISRSEVLQRISCQGLKILEDLGWPAAMNSYYTNLHTGDVATLESELWSLTDDLDPWRTVLHKYEEEINELTSGDFYCLIDETPRGRESFPPDGKCTLAGRGLECCTVKDMRWYLKHYPHIEQIVKEAVRAHKAFYENFSCGRHGEPKLLTDPYFRSDSCTHNIVGLSRMFGIDVDTLEDTSLLPPRSVEGHVWAVMECWRPATAEEVKVYQEKHPEGEEDVEED